MNILHISDLHFGPRHWDGNDKILLEKLNSYDADIVINTGDNTLPDNFTDINFIKCISIKDLTVLVVSIDTFFSGCPSGADGI